jgi:hypothetical protein
MSLVHAPAVIDNINIDIATSYSKNDFNLLNVFSMDKLDWLINSGTTISGYEHNTLLSQVLLYTH